MVTWRVVLVLIAAMAVRAHADPKSALACKAEDGERACRQRCDKGSQDSCAILGVMYLQGVAGGKPDPAHAEPLLERACAAKVALGCGGLGSLVGAFKKDAKRARTLLEKGCSLGDPVSCESVGGMILGAHERSPKPDTVAAARESYGFYKRACDLGSANGCGFCAVFIADKLVPGTVEQALDLYVKACSRGMAVACRQAVGLLTRNDPEAKALAATLDVPRLSADLLKRGCELGDAQSCRAKPAR
jgi:TPR repeat protein